MSSQSICPSVLLFWMRIYFPFLIIKSDCLTEEQTRLLRRQQKKIESIRIQHCNDTRRTDNLQSKVRWGVDGDGTLTLNRKQQSRARIFINKKTHSHIGEINWNISPRSQLKVTMTKAIQKPFKKIENIQFSAVALLLIVWKYNSGISKVCDCLCAISSNSNRMSPSALSKASHVIHRLGWLCFVVVVAVVVDVDIFCVWAWGDNSHTVNQIKTRDFSSTLTDSQINCSSRIPAHCLLVNRGCGSARTREHTLLIIFFCFRAFVFIGAQTNIHKVYLLDRWWDDGCEYFFPTISKHTLLIHKSFEKT